MYNGQTVYVPYMKRTKRSLNDQSKHMRYSSGELCHLYVVDQSQLRSNGHQRIHTVYLKDAKSMTT